MDKTIESILIGEDETKEKLLQLRKSVFLEIVGSPLTNPYQWEEVKLNDNRYFDIQTGSLLRKADLDPNGIYDVYGGNGIIGKHSDYLYENRKIIIGRAGAYCGNVLVSNKNFWVTNNALVLRVDTSEFLLDFVAQMIRMLDLNKLATGVTIPHLSVRTIKNQTVLKPPFEIQKKVSAYLQLIRDLEAKIDTRTSLIQELKETYKEIV